MEVLPPFLDMPTSILPLFMLAEIIFLMRGSKLEYILGMRADMSRNLWFTDFNSVTISTSPSEAEALP
jgi:hypothetical protein